MTIRPLRILVVEDNEARVETFTQWSPPGVRLIWARSAGVAIGMLKRDRGRVYDGIMLDHDLTAQRLTMHDGRFTGRDVVVAVIENVDSDVPVFVHSANDGGGPRMADTLRRAGFEVGQVPMYRLDERRLRDWIVEVREALDEEDDE